jgi:glycosyltransferase involved in cell wall biosynthesis
MPNPQTIALCVPAYNAARHLPRLFASIKAQTAPFDELWVYDDASTDETAAVARRLGALLVSGKVNLGCSIGKNTLLDHVRSEWVHFHDADDALNPEFVARSKHRIASSDFDVLLFDYEQVDEATGKLMSITSFAHSSVLEDSVRYMLRETVNNGGVYSVRFLRRTGAFDPDPAVRFNEDRAFHLRLAEEGARFAHEPYVGSRFFFGSNSMSAANQVKCALANQEITRRFAVRHPGDYAAEISGQSWKNAGILAAYLEWLSADECVHLAIHSGGRIPREGSALFKCMCGVNGRWAIRIRERLIRRFKSRYRMGFPG